MTAIQDPLTEALSRHFGYDQFRPGQREVMEHLLAGRPPAAVFPTGAGKSLCYQLPALQLDGRSPYPTPILPLWRVCNEV